MFLNCREQIMLLTILDKLIYMLIVIPSFKGGELVCKTGLIISRVSSILSASTKKGAKEYGIMWYM